ncbi:MAG: EAL domain-containing protein [Azonexus sp.]|nr:EAL domain-containing protein [Azonexus sp.]
MKRANKAVVNRTLRARQALAQAKRSATVRPFSITLAELARREDQFRREIIESLPGDFYMFDAAGRFILWNSNMEKSLRCSAEDIAAAHPLDFFVGDDVDKAAAVIAQALVSEGTVFAEAMLVAKDGSKKPYRFTAHRVLYNGQPVVAGLGVDTTRHQQAKEARQASEANLRALLDNLPHVAWLKDREGRYILINKAFADFFHVADVKDIVGKTDFDLIPQALAEKYRADDDEVMTTHRRMHVEEYVAEAGLDTWLETYKTPIIDARGKLLGTAGFARDITERKAREEELRISAVAFETYDAILITDRNNRIVRVNRAFTEITGYPSEEVLGKDPGFMCSGRHDPAFYKEMWQQLLDTGSWAGEIWDKRKSGEIYPKWLTISVVKNEQNDITHYVAIFSDITARKAAEKEIHSLAFYDTLTSLPNRRLFMERFHVALTMSARRNTFGAVLFIDLDRFKTLNDTLGHDYGDLLLVTVAARVKSCLREMDTVARLGGDEFVVLIEDVSENLHETSRRVGLIASKIREALALPYTLGARTHHCPSSIGISLYRGADAPADDVLRKADMAMYRVKADGGNAVRFFDPAMQQSVMKRTALENDLRHAVAHDGLQLYYQIQVGADQQPVGAEALLRWWHPQHGMVPPGQFIPLAEESALILEIGAWVLEDACRQLALWAKQKPLRHLTLAVNVSARQFAQPDFVGKVAAVMQRHGVTANLKLELTESVVVEDLRSTITKMQDLKQLGVQLAMDDFGTGYSSLSYLAQLPLDQLKIDQSFVQGITRSASDALLVQTIIDLARNFHLNVIAEGVETEAQLVFLQEKECLAYQGYLFGHPLPVDEFERLLAG